MKQLKLATLKFTNPKDLMPIYSLPSATKYLLFNSLKVQKDSCETFSSESLLFNGGKTKRLFQHLVHLLWSM